MRVVWVARRWTAALSVALGLGLPNGAKAQAQQPQPQPQPQHSQPPNQADSRRSGLSYMSPALQALQRDDSQNPAQLWVQEGALLWAKPPVNADGQATGRACAACHAAGAERGMATRYPAIDATNDAAIDPAKQRPLTLAGRIDQCRQRHQQAPPQGADGPEILALSAHLAQASRGLPLAAPSDAAISAWQARGHALWQQRMGQANLSCAQCHDQHPGAKLGGAVIPQGHPTGYPTYRLEWQGLGSLQRRMRACLVGVRAEPFTPNADEWLALETYLAKRASGMLMEGAALRP